MNGAAVVLGARRWQQARAVMRAASAVGEKSVMHSHPDSVVVFLEDQKAKMTHPDGKSEEMSGKKRRGNLYPGWRASARKHRHQPARCHPGGAKETGHEIVRFNVSGDFGF